MCNEVIIELMSEIGLSNYKLEYNYFVFLPIAKGIHHHTNSIDIDKMKIIIMFHNRFFS